MSYAMSQQARVQKFELEGGLKPEARTIEKLEI